MKPISQKKFAVTLYSASLLVIFFLAMQSSFIRADTIYTSYGPGQTFSPNSGIGIAGANSIFNSGYQAVATKFQPTEAGYLSAIDVPLGSFGFTGTENTVIFDLCEDSSGLPGQVLESFTVPIGPPGLGKIYTATSQLQPLLSTSTTYWLALLPEDPTTAGSWCYFNNFSLTSGQTVLDPGTGWYYPSQLRPLPFTIEGSPVPEPSIGALLLLAFGLKPAFLARRRSKV